MPSYFQPFKCLNWSKALQTKTTVRKIAMPMPVFSVCHADDSLVSVRELSDHFKILVDTKPNQKEGKESVRHGG